MKVLYRSVYPDDGQDELRVGLVVNVAELHILGRGIMEIMKAREREEEGIPDEPTDEDLLAMWEKLTVMYGDFEAYLNAARQALEGVGEEGIDHED